MEIWIVKNFTQQVKMFFVNDEDEDVKTYSKVHILPEDTDKIYEDIRLQENLKGVKLAGLGGILKNIETFCIENNIPVSWL